MAPNSIGLLASAESWRIEGMVKQLQLNSVLQWVFICLHAAYLLLPRFSTVSILFGYFVCVNVCYFVLPKCCPRLPSFAVLRGESSRNCNNNHISCNRSYVCLILASIRTFIYTRIFMYLISFRHLFLYSTFLFLQFYL